MPRGFKVATDGLIIRVFLDVLIMFVSFSVSLNTLRLLKLSKPHENGIESFVNFYPESNYPVLICIAVLTLLFFYGLKLLRAYSSSSFRAAFAAIIVFSLLIGVVAPYFSSFENKVDTFHHGEQLAPALAFSQGKTPYKDMYILHGAGEDVITPWISFRLFGESIGSYYLLIGILQLVATSFFILLVHKLFKHDVMYMLVVLWFAMNNFTTPYYVRDIPVWISILLIYYLLTTLGAHTYKKILLGLIASLTLFYSFDRGIFLSAIIAVVIATLLIFKKGDAYKVDMRGFTKRIKTIQPAAYGYMGGLFIGLVLLGFSGFSAFVALTIQMGHLQGAIFNYPYPGFGETSWFFWLPVIGFIVVSLVLIRDVRGSNFNFDRYLVFELILFVLSLIFFRAGTGRPDVGHLAYGSVILLLLFAYMLYRRFEILITYKPSMRTPIYIKYAPLAVFAALLASPHVVNYYRLAEMNQVPLTSTKIFLRAPTKPDSFWTDERIERATDRIKQLAKKQDDKLFVFADEPLFYYTTKMKNPTRFFITWFADPAPLESELLNDLKKSPPKVIVYESGQSFTDMPDYIYMKQRLPEVNKWVLANYKNRYDVNGVILLTK